MNDPHAGVQELLGYARGELDRDTADRVRAHCFECIDCGDQLAALVLLRRASSEIGVVDRSPGRAGMAAAAVFVVLIGLTAWTLWLRHGDAEPAGAVPAVVEGSASETPGEASPALTEAEGDLIRLLGRAAQRLAGNAAAVAAGVVGTDSPTALGDAGAALERGDFASVVRILDGPGVARDSLGNAVVGAALYADGQGARALAVLEPEVQAIRDRGRDPIDWRLEEEIAVLLVAQLYAAEQRIPEAVELLAPLSESARRDTALYAAELLAEFRGR